MKTLLSKHILDVHDPSPKRTTVRQAAERPSFPFDGTIPSRGQDKLIPPPRIDNDSSDAASRAGSQPTGVQAVAMAAVSQ